MRMPSLSLGVLPTSGAGFNAGACQYQLPGVNPNPNLPFCGPGGYQAPLAACGGMLPGDPGYSECIAQQVQVVAANNPAMAPAYAASFGPELAANQAAIAAAKPIVVPAKPVQPAGPVNSAMIPITAQSPSGNVTQTQLNQVTQSGPLNLTGGSVPVASNAPNFLTESLFGGIPNWALLAATGLGAVLLMGGRR